MTKPITNYAASVRSRLLDETRRRKGDFQLTLQRYVAERFLYRLGASPHRECSVLKGAMLFVLWVEAPIRPTRDLDLAGYWSNDAASLEVAFREMCKVASPHDGLHFALDTLTIAPIRDVAEYHGFRLNLDVRLGDAVISFQVDVGFGDAIVPAPVDVDYPVMLDGEVPHVRAYPREAVIAEKLHAMVLHAEANSRYKDFFDVVALSVRFAFTGQTLVEAIKATFARRNSANLTPWPVALTSAFYADGSRSLHWGHFLKRSKLVEAPADFSLAGERVTAFLEAPVRAASTAEPFALNWQPGGPWQ